MKEFDKRCTIEMTKAKTIAT
jgi:hypothetical protein